MVASPRPLPVAPPPAPRAPAAVGPAALPTSPPTAANSPEATPTGSGGHRACRSERRRRDAGAKVPARLAGAKVRAHPACPGGCAHRAPKASADLVALHLAPLSHLAQRQARLVHHLASRGLGGGERLRDLGVAQAAQLAHDQGDTLAVRQRVEVGDELAQTLARFGPRSPPPAPAAPAAPDRRPRDGGAGSRSTRCGRRGKATGAARSAARRRAAPSGRPPSCSGARPAPRGDPPGLRDRSDRAPGDSAERSSRTRAGRPRRARPARRSSPSSLSGARGESAGRVPPPRQWPSP